jgi:hypothetical protein
MDALGAMRTYMDAVVKSTELMMSPKALAEHFKRWANPSDPKAKALLEKATSGDGSAMKHFQQLILNTEFGECECGVLMYPALPYTLSSGPPSTSRAVHPADRGLHCRAHDLFWALFQ